MKKDKSIRFIGFNFSIFLIYSSELNDLDFGRLEHSNYLIHLI